MPTFKCKMCGGTLEINQNDSTATCEYCGTQQTLPKLDDEKRVNLYDRANHFRRNNEFDKAMGIYEQILNEDNTDAEAYWSLVLCRYGIEYVEDPLSHRRVPTVHRAQFTSIFDDDNYKMALKNADMHQRILYEEEAKAINEIQKGILAISSKEEPFDVFICYKETDDSGKRTHDSVLAQDLYYQLTQEGLKVFFAKITLEDKLGSAYEPYIFAALNSAKVMVVLGTRSEYFNAVWVKNEWSRFLSLIKNGEKKMLIPAYKDMDPYDLPDEFSHLQAQDMSKLGFMQDLIRGIKKITNTIDTTKNVTKEIVKDNNQSVLLKRVFMFLEDSNWEQADLYCEKVLDIDPENAEAYLGKLMVETKANNLIDLSNRFFSSTNQNYKNAIKYGNETFINELRQLYKSMLEKITPHFLDNSINEFIKLNNIKVLDIPSSVTTIKYNTFKECSSLTSIVIPNSVTSIGYAAFAKCSSLRSIIIPNSVTSIEGGAFSECSSLKYNEYDNGLYLGNEDNPYLVLVKAKDRSITSCVINENTRFIYGFAFYGCSFLTTITIPSSVTSIGYAAFYGCSSLTGITIPSSVTSIESDAFKNCNNIIIKNNSNLSISNSNSCNGCYIATSVYGSYDCPQVWTLRRYRDDMLSSTWYGRLFIHTYYAISPTLVKWFGKTKWFKRFWKKRLDRMIDNLKSSGVEDTPYEDKEW